jgi:hypothetical protein
MSTATPEECLRVSKEQSGLGILVDFDSKTSFWFLATVAKKYSINGLMTFEGMIGMKQ